ncbi:MAG: hypothetical protein C9356_11080 [Oleiphilus sp.]|nr:MAG: hypothetical protein C9356_11080 [Oleiphilus sp.]
MNNTLYRSEIDGLRAIAVVVVILFHFGIAPFGGGFVGVDVFFVISGYLITRLITKEQQADRFTFGNFYSRRIRRLFPALFVVLFACFVAAFMMFSPEHMERFSGALFYALASISNLYFWMESGYFDLSSSVKPLLHTWSLSVEEQFYLVWPLFIVLLVKHTTKALLISTIALISITTLLYAEYLLTDHASSAFYLTPFRIYEFGIGALLVFLPRRTLSNTYKEILAFGGFALLIYSVVFFSEATPFPGLHALIPCLGAACLIIAGDSRALGSVLRARIMVRLGLTSYSAYLVHWPLYVFYSYAVHRELDWPDFVVLFVATMVLAELSYRFVESPFRRRQDSHRTAGDPGFALACLSMVLILSVPAATAWSQNGWSWRTADEIQELAKLGDRPTELDAEAWGLGSCYIGGIGGSFVKTNEIFPDDFDVKNCFAIDDEKPNVMLIGDSTAAHLIYGLRKQFPEVRFIQVTASSCRPIINWSAKHRCNDLVDFALFKYLPKYQNAISAVIFAGRWYGEDLTIKRLAQTVKRVRRDSHNVDLIVLGDQLEYKEGISSLASKHGRLSGLNQFLEKSRTKYEQSSNTLLREEVSRWAGFEDFHDYLCKETCSIFIDNELTRPLTLDGVHLTREGSDYIARRLREGGFLSKYINQRISYAIHNTSAVSR